MINETSNPRDGATVKWLLKATADAQEAVLPFLDGHHPAYNYFPFHRGPAFLAVLEGKLIGADRVSNADERTVVCPAVYRSTDSIYSRQTNIVLFHSRSMFGW